MKIRQSLIRLYKWQVDEARKHLAELLALRDELRRKVALLDETVVQEQAVVRSSIERDAGNATGLAFTYAPYAQAAVQKRENLLQSITSLAVRVSTAEDAVAEAFKTLKRQEIAAANQENRETRERDRKAQIASDEMALQLHERKRTAR